MAEGLLRNKIPQELQGRVIIKSAGTFFIDGIGADPMAIKALAQKTVDISRHRSQGLTLKLVNKADLILVMSESHLEFFADAEPGIRNKIYLLKTYGKTHGEIDALAMKTVIDPIGGSMEDFEACAQDIEAEIDRIWPIIRQEIAKRIKVKISD